jgi:hypothetical protein
VMISTRSAALVIDTVVCLALAKWETVSGRFGGYLSADRRDTYAQAYSPPGWRPGSTLPDQRYRRVKMYARSKDVRHDVRCPPKDVREDKPDSLVTSRRFPRYWIRGVW